MELMVVIVIVGILAAIAYPSYRDQVRRSNRTEAKVALEQTAQALEKCFTRYMAYNNPNCGAAEQLDGGSFDTPEGNYRITGDIGETEYDITATPLGGQASDTRCGALTLDETGQRGINGSGNAQECW